MASCAKKLMQTHGADDIDMPWHVVNHPALEVVEVAFVGAMTTEEVTAAAQASLSALAQAGTRLLLADCTQLDGGQSLADLYFLARDVQHLPGATSMCEAIVLPSLPGARSAVSFWETTALNSGLNVRAFTSRADALAWLAAQREAGTRVATPAHPA